MNLWEEVGTLNKGKPVLFDAMNSLKGKPPLLAGCYPALNLTSWYFYRYDAEKKRYATEEGISTKVIEEKQPVAYRRQPFGLYILDIEEWSFAPHQDLGQAVSGAKELRKALEASQRVIQRETGRTDRPGLYSVAPSRDLQVAADPNKKPGTLYYRQWQESNDFALDQLGEHLGYIAPSLYRYPQDLYVNTYYDFLKWNLDEAFRLAEKIKVPVASFVWPQYYGGLDDPRSGKWIEYTVFKQDLETILAAGSHVILWDWASEWSNDKSLAHEAILDVAAKQHGTIR